MVISTNQKPTIYRKLYENTAPGISDTHTIPSKHATSAQCWINVGPASEMIDQYCWPTVWDVGSAKKQRWTYVWLWSRNLQHFTTYDNKRPAATIIPRPARVILNSHFLFYSNGPPIYHSLSCIGLLQILKSMMVASRPLLNLIKLNFFRAYPSQKPHILCCSNGPSIL